MVTKKKWIKDQWLTFTMNGGINMFGVLQVGLAMSGKWNRPFGIPTIKFGNVWGRVVWDILKCATAVAVVGATAVGGTITTAVVGLLGGSYGFLAAPFVGAGVAVAGFPLIVAACLPGIGFGG